MESQLSYFKSWKMMLWKCCTQYANKFGKLSSGHRTGTDQFSFQSQRKAIPKNAQTTAQGGLVYCDSRGGKESDTTEQRNWTELNGFLDFPGDSDSEGPTCNVGDLGSIPGLGRSPGGGHGNPLQYCLENLHEQRAWQATIHGVAKGWTCVSNTMGSWLCKVTWLNSCASRAHVPKLEKSLWFISIYRVPQLHAQKLEKSL